MGNICSDNKKNLRTDKKLKNSKRLKGHDKNQIIIPAISKSNTFQDISISTLLTRRTSTISYSNDSYIQNIDIRNNNKINYSDDSYIKNIDIKNNNKINYSDDLYIQNIDIKNNYNNNNSNHNKINKNNKLQHLERKATAFTFGDEDLIISSDKLKP